MNNNQDLPNHPILVFAEGISYAHISRALIMAKWLQVLHEPILVACPKSSASLFTASGFPTISIETADPKAIYRRLTQGGTLYTTEDLLQYFEQDERLLQQVRPRLVVAEFRFTLLQLAKKYSIPGVAMTDATCHPHFVPDGSLPDSFIQPPWLPIWLLEFISKQAPVKQQIIQKLSLPYQQASDQYGVEVLPSFFHYASQGDICLLCDHPALIPIESLRPQDMYTGVMLWERSESLPPEIVQLDSQRQTVYISLGTQESLPTDFVEMYVKELLAHNLQIVLSRGKRTFSMSTTAKNLFVFDFVNDSKLLPLVDLMVYPGGAMSTYQALSCAVPLIALPAHANQHFYAEAIVKNNLGCLFRPSRLKNQELLNTTINLLSDSKTAIAIQAFQQKLANYNQQEAVLARIKTL